MNEYQQLQRWRMTSAPEQNKDGDLVFLLRGRKLFGDARRRQTSAGRRQWQADEQPPAGAGQTATQGLTSAVLHMRVCVVAHRAATLQACEFVCVCATIAINYFHSDHVCRTLTETLRTMDLSVLQPFLPGQPKHFANFLDKAVGLRWHFGFYSTFQESIQKIML